MYVNIAEAIFPQDRTEHDKGAFEECAPFVWSFIKQNRIVRDEKDNLISAIYASRNEDSYYLFIRKKKSFGFHLTWGNLEEVLNEKSVKKILRNLESMEEIQKFVF